MKGAPFASREPAMPPMPPPEMRFKVSGGRDEEAFDASGVESVVDFTHAVAGLGRSLADFPRILEWGCGSGRILRHFPFDPVRQELHGCDIDPEMIAWLGEAMPELKVAVSGGLPPLPYADGQFDLIINHSVLTHLDAAYQDAWLTELKRILSPDGVLILTVQGPYALAMWEAELPGGPAANEAIRAARRALDETGVHFLADDAWAGLFPKYYQSTFHAHWYVFDHWSRWFDIVDYRPRGSLHYQDMVVMRHKRPGPAPRALGPGFSFMDKVAWKLGRRPR